MLTDTKLVEIRECLATVSDESQVYIGCDSSRYQKKKSGEWFASYTTAVVIHKDNSHGCRVFCNTETMRDYDQKADRPAMRMQNEAYKAVEAYQQLEEDLMEREVQIHLDINANPVHGSNCAMSAAVGYARGVTGRDVFVKPFAFAASYAADHGVRGGFRG